MSGIPPTPHPLTGTAPEAILFAEDAIRPLRHEVAIWFDRQGNEIGRRQGTASEVAFTAAELTLLKDATFTHNHPLGWDFPPSDPRHAGSSFADEDFAFAVAADLAEIRAIAPRWRFSARRPSGGWGIRHDDVRNVYAALMVLAVAELDLARRLGSITLEEAEASLYHVVAERLVRQLGGDYRRWAG